MKIISRKGMINLCLITLQQYNMPYYCVIHSKSCADIYLYGSPDGEHYTAVKMFHALLISEVSYTMFN